MAIVKKLRVKQADGTFGDFIYIGSEASNVTLTNAYSVEEVIGVIDVANEGNISEQLRRTDTYSENIKDLTEQVETHNETINSVNNQISSLEQTVNSSNTDVEELNLLVQSFGTQNNTKNIEQDNKIVLLENTLNEQVTNLQKQITNLQTNQSADWGAHTIKIFTDTSTNEVRTGIYYKGGNA